MKWFSEEGTLMEIFWIVVFANAGIIVFSLLLEIAGWRERFWEFVTEVSDRLLVRRWDEDWSHPKTLSSSFKV
jgi:hypothetical protein